MILPAFARTMARYNNWQNANLIAAAGNLSDAERRRDRGAFFGSIFATLVHLYWADTMWMHRFTGSVSAHGATPADSPGEVDDWQTYCDGREVLDRLISDWAANVSADALLADISYFSAAVNRQITEPLGLIATHMFNHQAHHRGQVHVMLTAAGARPGDTDLPLMPKPDQPP